jgi:hypothetical protein
MEQIPNKKWANTSNLTSKTSKNSRLPREIETTREERINSKIVTKTEEEMIEEEISIGERKIMQNEETTLRTMPTKMKTTMRTILRACTIWILITTTIIFRIEIRIKISLVKMINIGKIIIKITATTTVVTEIIYDPTTQRIIMSRAVRSPEVETKAWVPRTVMGVQVPKAVKRLNESEWGAPSFGIPKNGEIRFVSAFFQLNKVLRSNKVLRRKPYPLPVPHEYFRSLDGFSYCTSMDLKMGYWAIRLSLYSHSTTMG